MIPSNQGSSCHLTCEVRCITTAPRCYLEGDSRLIRAESGAEGGAPQLATWKVYLLRSGGAIALVQKILPRLSTHSRFYRPR